MYSLLKSIYPTFKIRIYENLYFFGFILLLIYENVLQFLLKFDKKLPFLPLMLTSIYCSVGVLYFYCKYYYKFLSTTSNEIKKKTK